MLCVNNYTHKLVNNYTHKVLGCYSVQNREQ